METTNPNSDNKNPEVPRINTCVNLKIKPNLLRGNSKKMQSILDQYVDPERTKKDFDWWEMQDFWG